MSYLRSKRRRSERRRSASRGAYAFENASEVSAQAETWAPARPIVWAKAPSAILGATCLALLAFFFVAPPFYVVDIEASGNGLISTRELLSTAGIRGWSAFYVNERDIERRIIGQFPCIEWVRVQCRLPAKVSIAVRERVPTAVWEAHNGRFLIDGEGRIIKTTDSLQDLLLIKDGDRRSVALGEELGAAEAIATAQGLHELLSEARVFAFSRDKGIILNHPSGYEVYFGVGGKLEDKVNAMQALVRWVASSGRTDVAYLDVRFQRPTVGYRDG